MKIEDKIVQFLIVRAEYLQQRSPLLRKRLDRKYDSLLAAIAIDNQRQLEQVREWYDEARGMD